MDMDAITKTIGVIVLSLIIIAIPVLCGLSYGLDWYDPIKFMLTVSTVALWFSVVIKIANDTT